MNETIAICTPRIKQLEVSDFTPNGMYDYIHMFLEHDEFGRRASRAPRYLQSLQQPYAMRSLK